MSEDLDVRKVKRVKGRRAVKAIAVAAEAVLAVATSRRQPKALQRRRDMAIAEIDEADLADEAVLRVAVAPNMAAGIPAAINVAVLPVVVVPRDAEAPLAGDNSVVRRDQRPFRLPSSSEAVRRSFQGRPASLAWSLRRARGSLVVIRRRLCLARMPRRARRR